MSEFDIETFHLEEDGWKYGWSYWNMGYRDSSVGTSLWRRYYPTLIYPLETARNSSLLYLEFLGSHEKMMIKYSGLMKRQIVSAFEKQGKENDYLKIKGFNYTFSILDWAFEFSLIHGRAKMPTSMGRLSNLLRIGTLIKKPKTLRNEINTLYCKTVFPIICALNGNVYFNVGKETENHINRKGLEVLVSALNLLEAKLIQWVSVKHN